MTPEYSLLHSQFLHFLEDHGSLGNISPKDDRIHTGIFDHLQLTSKVCIAAQEFLFDDDRMPEATRGITKFDHSKSTVAIVDSQQSNSFQAPVRCRCGEPAYTPAHDRLEYR